MRDSWRAAAPAAGALFGLATFAIGLGLPLVDPWNIAWAVAGGDVQFHFIGWHMFRHDAWRWPPGVIANLGHPVGTSIGFTDSIPLLALLFKPFGRLVEGDIQYFGLWLLASYILQGVFGALLLRTFVRSPLLQMLGAALFVMSPPFVFRYGHVALTAHWQLLAALWLYFEEPSFRPRVAAAWIALSALAAATHPYLAMMVLVLGAAHHAAMAIAGREVLAPAVSLTLSTAAAGATSWLSGYFVLSDPADVQAAGLGHYSANLLAFVMPVEQASPFGPGPFSYATSGQYEGYAYLGLGGVVLAIIAIVLAIVAAVARGGRSLGPVCALPRLPLVCAASLFLVMAVSPRVTAGSRLLFEYDPGWWGPLTMFRASGRMIWPVFYLVLLGVVVAVSRGCRPRWAAAILGVAVVLQGADMWGTYRGLAHVKEIAWRDPLQSPLWQAAAPRYAHLVLIPSNMCAAHDVVGHPPFALLAGRAGATLNSGYATRYDAAKIRAYCAELTRRLAGGDVRDDELYVLDPARAVSLHARARTPLVCTEADGHTVCVTIASYRRWHHLYDIERDALPPAEEIVRFRGALEAIYRDELRRAAVPAAYPPDMLSEALARYIAYRRAGCAHDSAMRRSRGRLEGRDDLPFCLHETTSRALPPAAAVIEFRRSLEQGSPEAGRTAQPALTHVDAEGDAVWTLEYVRRRLEGHSETEALADVRSAIRAIVGLE